MIRNMDAPADVVACSVDGGFSASDLDEYIARIARSLEFNRKTHLFVEIASLDGIDWREVAKRLRPGIGMLAKLDRFGRIAVVSDDMGVRGLTRLESALLPNISYEIFKRRKRDRALAWVKGEISEPHAPSITMIPTSDRAVIAFAIDGRVTKADLEQAMAELRPRLQGSEAPIRVLARVRDIDLPEIASLFDAGVIGFKNDVLRRVELYALVGGPAWLGKAATLLASLFTFQLRHFSASDEQSAWRWIKAKPMAACSAAQEMAA